MPTFCFPPLTFTVLAATLGIYVEHLCPVPFLLPPSAELEEQPVCQGMVVMWSTALDSQKSFLLCFSKNYVKVRPCLLFRVTTPDPVSALGGMQLPVSSPVL